MSDPLRQIPDVAKHGMDVLSIGTIVGTLTQYLPALAALFTIVWTMIRIYETRTVQRWLDRDGEAVESGSGE